MCIMFTHEVVQLRLHRNRLRLHRMDLRLLLIVHLLLHVGLALQWLSFSAMFSLFPEPADRRGA